jgi:hypothetical protein
MWQIFDEIVITPPTMPRMCDICHFRAIMAESNVN